MKLKNIHEMVHLLDDIDVIMVNITSWIEIKLFKW